MAQDFLKLVYASNPGIRYRYFGGVDADGFWIHHLCEATGGYFEPFAMSADKLQKPAYVMCLHPLSHNDSA